MSIEQQQPFSKIFVRNVTILDCGVWDRACGPVGRSWSVDVEWHGTTDHEGVVVDFSSAKKIAKSVIDNQFDHRLLVSEQNVTATHSGRKLCLPYHATAPENRFLIDTYPQSLAIVSEQVAHELTEGSCKALERILAQAIHAESPSSISLVKVKLNVHSQANEPHFFNYLHSLRLHSGNCQRFHGHSNVVEIFRSGEFDGRASEQVARFLDGRYLVTASYICESGDPKSKQLYGDALAR